LAYLCKSCEAEYKREYYIKNKTKIVKQVAARNKSFIKRRREWLKQFKLCCIICGESDPVVLDFDHRDPTKKLSAVSKLVQNWGSIKAVEAEIEKCDVLCSNCHRRKTAREFRWYI